MNKENFKILKSAIARVARGSKNHLEAVDAERTILKLIKMTTKCELQECPDEYFFLIDGMINSYAENSFNLEIEDNGFCEYCECDPCDCDWGYYDQMEKISENQEYSQAIKDHEKKIKEMTKNNSEK